ncbi:MAG: FAD-dependent oxidoreductase, partial [Pseudomonadota bacterium]
MSLSGHSGSNRLFPSPAIAPCRLACPINQNVQEYVACIAESRFSDAAAVIRRTNPFPSVCGRLCPHPCEFECSRGAVDGCGPVAIRELKRFTADLEAEAIENDFPVFPQTRDQKIAVIGAGPAGLTAAFDLRKLGYSVTVYESMPFAGGLLALSCTPQVLPPEILGKDIEAIRAAGVDIINGTTLGKDPSIQDLRRLGFAAILIATGAGRVLLQGEIEEAKELGGFLEPSDWLRGRKKKAPGLKGKKVVIDGVTSWSVHWAMLAAADGAKSVTLLTHLPAALLPVEKQFMKMAKAAGVRLMALHGPERIVSTSGAISGVELRKYKVDGSDPRGRVRLKKAARRRKMIAAQIFIPTGPSVFD